MTTPLLPDNQPQDDGIILVDDPYGLDPSSAVSEENDSRHADSGRLPETAGMAEDAPEPEEEKTLGEEVRATLSPTMHEIGTHLDELRKRLVISLAAFVPFFALGLVLYRTLWSLVVLPLDRAAPHLLRFQALGPSDGLVMTMRIAFAFALFLSMPVWLGQLWSFIAPGLTAREKRWLYISLGAGTLLFVIGASMAYLVGIPLALEFLLPFNQTLAGWENAFTGRDYVDFVVTCCFGFGVAFELPLVMLVLGWFGILSPEGLRQYWRPVILVIFMFSAVLTPPDPFTQLLMALPMLCLFALGYFLVKWVQPGK